MTMLAAVPVMLLLLLATPATAATRVFILLGQSNMSGTGQSRELPARLARIPTNCELWVRTNPTRAMRLATFRDLPLFGPEVMLAHRLCQLYPPDDVLVFVKSSIGGTSLLAWSPTWSYEEAEETENGAAGPLYAFLWRQIESAVGGRRATFEGAFIMQGERDTRFATAARRYRQNFVALARALREDAATPKLPIIYGIVSPPVDPDNENQVRLVDMVTQAQIELPRHLDAIYPVGTHGLRRRRGDADHYDTTGQLWLGKRMAEAFYRNIKKPDR